MQLADGLNLIYGANGSGKTSILEAAYFLGMGRSFRSHLSQRIINTQHSECTVFGQVFFAEELNKIGIRRQRSGNNEIRINGENTKGLAQLTAILPIQIITPESFAILFEGPKARRQFMDWGVFHSQPTFHRLWAATKRLLKQRNALLKSQSSPAMLNPWDKELINLAEQVSSLRNNYIASLNEVLKGIIEQFLPDKNVVVSYYQGWDKTLSYQEVLAKQNQRDRELGYTVSGPHKADLRLKVGNMPAQDALSRGQLKLLVCALRIAQGQLLAQQTGKDSIYLVDDLPSELDAKHRGLLLSQLQLTQAQILVTAIEPSAIIDSLSQPPSKMFHVEQGKVVEQK